ncbi:MAG TPA: hypothetical protein PLQ76_02355, partial [bacterium]|nr:hypothetical protein [bacterium]
MTDRVKIIIAAIGFIFCCAGSAAAAIPKWGLFESVAAPGVRAANPFDPEQADVNGEFIAPGGKKFVAPAFAFRDFQR